MPAASAASLRLMPASALAIASRRRATRPLLSLVESLRSTTGVRSLLIASAVIPALHPNHREQGITDPGYWESLRRNRSRNFSTAVSFGHWTFLRVLWEAGRLTQRELSEQ